MVRTHLFFMKPILQLFGTSNQTERAGMSCALLCVRASCRHKPSAMSGHTRYIIQFTSSQLVSTTELHKTGLFVLCLHHFTEFKCQLIIKNAALAPYGSPSSRADTSLTRDWWAICIFSACAILNRLSLNEMLQQLAALDEVNEHGEWPVSARYIGNYTVLVYFFLGVNTW